MNRGIFIVLGSIIILGLLSLYALQQGPVLLLRAPKEERIAFISDRGGQVDVWTMRTDGSDVRQVTSDSADDQIPGWSPDGRELVSISDRRNRVYQVFLSAWDGRYTHDLSSSEGTKDTPVWGKDGREITFINGGKVYGIRRSGGQEQQYLPLPGMSAVELPGRSNFVYGAWSPDGRMFLCVQETDQGRFAFAATRDDIEAWDGGQLKTTPIVVAHGVHAVWAPSGYRIAVSFVGREGQHGISIVDLDAVSGKDLCTFDGDTMAPGELAWSPDGKTLVFEMWTVQEGMLNRPLSIYTVNTSGGKPRVVVKGDAREPCWSPDGKQIAYTGITGKEHRDIWRVNADGTGAMNLTKGRGDSYNPAWSPLSPKK